MTVVLARIILVILLVTTIIDQARCQSTASPQRKAALSSGLKAAIGKISILTHGQLKEVVIQLILENITKDRIYIFATGDRRASLSDGNSLSLKEIIGLTYCFYAYNQEQNNHICLDRHGSDLNYYSYIESGDKADLSLRYTPELASDGYSPSGSISFRLIMASRVAHAAPNSLEAQADPKNITSPQVVILNFPLTPLKVTVD